MQKRIVILGAGEIGISMSAVLAPYHDVEVYGRLADERASSLPEGSPDLLIIAFPYSDEFKSEVERYKKMFQPKHTVIVATVPPGTSREVGATFSYVCGVHPFLEDGIKTFKRFIAGPEASYVAHYFKRAGLSIHLYDQQETAELAKISQTTFYAVMIEYVKDLKRECDKRGLSFSEVYTLPSIDYNEGYAELGYPEFKMPLLVPMLTKQGGHCTIPNLEFWDTEFTRLVKKLNALYE